MSYLTPVVQVPPRGLWRQSGQARWTTAEAWLGQELSDQPSSSDVLLRYLAAFGPATVRDIQAWSGLTRLRTVTAQLAERLRTCSDEDGNELLDVHDAPLPSPDTPAPPRFLPPFDNAILSHADRTRIIAPEHRALVYRDRLMRAFLVDGFVAGTWRNDGGTLLVEPFAPIAPKDRKALSEEGERLLTLLAPDAAGRDVEIGPA